MPVEIVAWTSKNARLAFRAEEVADGWRLLSIHFYGKNSGEDAQGAFTLDVPIIVPASLVAIRGTEKHFRTWAELNRNPVDSARRNAAAAVEKLTSELTGCLIGGVATNDVSAGFLGTTAFAGATTNFTLYVDVAGLFLGNVKSTTPVMRATATARFAAGYRSPFTLGTASADLVVELQLTRDEALTLVPRIAVPHEPALGVGWEGFRLAGNISLNGLQFGKLETLCHIPGPFGGEAFPVFIEWSQLPAASFGVNAQGALFVATAIRGRGRIAVRSAGGTRYIADLRDVDVAASNAGVDVVATLTNVASIGTLKLPDGYELPESITGPFLVRLFDFAITTTITLVVGSPAQINFIFYVGRCEIRARTDPSLMLAIKLGISFGLENSTFVTTLTELELVEPRPLNLLLGASHVIEDAQRRLLAVVQAINVPAPSTTGFQDSVAVLDRLGRMMAEVAAWLSRHGLGGLRSLAGLAEAGFHAISEVLLDLVSRIRGAAQSIVSDLVVEVRFDLDRLQVVQVIVSPKAISVPTTYVECRAVGLLFKAPLSWSPSFVCDFDESWAAVVLQPIVEPTVASLSTDLWLGQPQAPSRPVSGEDQAGNIEPLIDFQIGAKPNLVLAPIMTVSGRAAFFHVLETTATSQEIKNRNGAVVVSANSQLVGARFKSRRPATENDATISSKIQTERVLSFFRCPHPDADPNESPFNQLGQYIKVKPTAGSLFGGVFSQPMDVTIAFGGQGLSTTLRIEIVLATLQATLNGDSPVIGIDVPTSGFSLLGMTARVQKKGGGDLPSNSSALLLDFTTGEPALKLNSDIAQMELSFGALSSVGKGLCFAVSEFSVSSTGIDLRGAASAEPVTLAGIDMPFRFSSGSIVVRRSRIQAFSLTGFGNLPPALVGEAKATILLNFGEERGALALIAADALLDKSNDPLKCESTRFSISVTKLGLRFVRQEGYHFYFTLTGSAEFRPGKDEFTSGLLKHLRAVRITLDAAPLASDPRVLLRHIEFQVPISPGRRTSLFDVFSFELRGIGFHPASPAFNGSPALSISGQVKFTDFGDIVTPRFDFHKLWIAPAAQSGSLPRVRFDGLGVGLRLGSMAEVSGTARAVDKGTTSLFADGDLGEGITAEGFLAMGSLHIAGWVQMQAAMGFLELSDKKSPEKRSSFFLYMQQDDLSEKIPTPLGPLYLREAGFGFGYRYTLAGLARADQTSSPVELVRLLDDVSKYQSRLSDFKAWLPTYHNDSLTLAMRALISMTTASKSGQFNAEKEESLPNLVLMSVVAGLRSDLTFLMNVAGYIAYNYADWRKASRSGTEAWQNNPGLRGYMYLSVPRREYLARALYEPGAPIGDHPKLPDALKRAMQGVRWSSTTYIRPGLYHQEFGWPFQLGFVMGSEADPFFMSVEGGTVLRYEDASLLYGIAFRAKGRLRFAGEVGGDFGASASAEAAFAVGAKLIAYVGSAVAESMFYGQITLDLTVTFSVQVWLKTKWFSASAGFSASLTVHVSAEIVFTPAGLGADVQASVEVGAFGRSLSIGVGFSFGAGRLAEARARVARFMALGLGADYPDPEQGVPSTPQPISSSVSEEKARDADGRIEDAAHQALRLAHHSAANVRADDALPCGLDFDEVHYWALLYPVGSDDKTTRYFLIQLIPKAANGVTTGTTTSGPAAGEFYAARLDNDGGVPEYRVEGIHADEILTTNFASSPGTVAIKTDWEATFGFNGTGVDAHPAPKLGEVDSECFLGSTDSQVRSEPLRGDTNERRLSEDRAERERIAADASRSRARLGGIYSASQRVEEVRSSVIVTVGQAAFELAKRVRVVGGKALVSTGTPLEFDPRAIGLTFVLSEPRIGALFPSKRRPSDTFVIRTRLPRKTPLLGSGSVEIFNPPDRMFVSARPILDKPSEEIRISGVHLFWDLKPRWPGSGAQDDPELHLKHYRIERRILQDGLTEKLPLPRVTTVKRANLVHFDVSGTSLTRTRLKSRLQYVDDLSDLPKAWRVAILPTAVQKLSDETSTDWTDAEKRTLEELKRANVRIEYRIRAVDSAGTHADLQPRVVTRPAIRPIEKALARATARFDYGDRLPTISLFIPPENGKRPFLSMSIEAAEVLPKGVRFQLRVQQERTIAAGVFGADALTQARTAPPPPDLLEPSANERDFNLRPSGQSSPSNLKLLVKISWRVGSDGRLFEAAPETYEVAESRSEFLDALDIPNSQSPVFARTLAIRLYLRVTPGDAREPAAWTPVQLQMRAGSPAVDPSDPEEDVDKKRRIDQLPVDATIERFEHPIEIDFKPIAGAEIQASAGRLERFCPKPGSTFRQFVESSKVHNWPLVSQRDGDRRSAVRLAWPAKPISLARVGSDALPADVSTIVGGFDIFSLDATAVPRKESEWDYISFVDRVQRLPTSELGQSPAEIGNLARVEVLYPSDTYRLDGATGSQPKRIWFSPAESFLAWPKRMLRRTILPCPPEAELALLFANGPPKELRVSWRFKTGSDFSRDCPDLKLAKELKDSVKLAASEGTSQWLLSRIDGKPFTIDLARRTLIGLLVANASKCDEIVSRMPRAYDDAGLLIEAVTDKAATYQQVSFEIDLCPRLHPFIADVLDMARYVNLDDQSRVAYRRYEPVFEDTAPVTAKTVGEFLDQTAPDADPAGWAVLRALGLASAFRLFDAEVGEFASAETTRARLRVAFDIVSGRYEEPKHLGVPFVDLFATPDAISSVSSFSGGSNIDAREFAERLLSVHQIELRPAILSNDDLVVSYYALKWRWTDRSGSPLRPMTPLRLSLNAIADNVLLDIVPRMPMAGVPAGGIQLIKNWAWPRFPKDGDEQVSTATNFAPGPAIDDAPDDGGEVTVAYVRAIRIRDDAKLPLSEDAIKNCVEGLLSVGVDESWRPFGSGVVRLVPGPRDYSNDRPASWGRFTDLSGPRMAALLFGVGLPDGLRVNAACGTLDAVLHHFPSLRGADGSIQVPSAASEPAIAARIGTWSRRFMEQGPAEPSAANGEISVAFGILTRPNPWRVAPDSTGKLSVLLYEKDRFGKTRKYAIRPFGRYDGLSQAIYAAPVSKQELADYPRLWAQKARPDLSCIKAEADALDAYFADVAIDRSEPLAMPVVLAARLRDSIISKDVTSSDRSMIELIVGRHPEDILADANIRTDAAASMRHMAVALYREFPAPSWAEAFTDEDNVESPDIDVLPQFGPFNRDESSGALSGTVMPPKELTLSKLSVTGKERNLIRLWAGELPDLWSGAYALSFANVPYAYRFYAEVHAAAGVVVSEPNVVQIGQVKAEHRSLAPRGKRPSWQAEAPNDEPKWDVVEIGSTRSLRITWPLVRLIDGMSDEGIALWFQNSHAPAMYRIADPDVCYRLTIESDDGTARVDEIEIASIPEGTAARQALYRVDAIGRRFQPSQLTQPRQIKRTHYRVGVDLSRTWDSIESKLEPEQDAAWLPASAVLPVPLSFLGRISLESNDSRKLSIVREAIPKLKGLGLERAMEELETLNTTSGARRGRAIDIHFPWDRKDRVLNVLREIEHPRPVSEPKIIRFALSAPLTQPELDDVFTIFGLEFCRLVRRMSDELVFGAGRRPVLQILRGALKPIIQSVERM